MGNKLSNFVRANRIVTDEAILASLVEYDPFWDDRIIGRIRRLTAQNVPVKLDEVVRDVVGTNSPFEAPQKPSLPEENPTAKEPGKLKSWFQGQRERFDRRKLFSNKWMTIGTGVILIIVILVVAILLFGNSNPGTTYYAATQVPQSTPIVQSIPTTSAPAWVAPPITIQPTTSTSLHGLNLKINLLSLGFVALILFSLLESVARGDFILLDFFATWGLVALFEFGQIYHNYSTWTWGVFFGVGMLGMIIATIWNPSEENEPKWWNRIDTTHWYVVGLALIIIYLMRSTAIPYPTYIPIIIPILATIVGIGKEIFRQVMFSLLAIAIGIVPAVLQTPVALALGLAAEVIIAAAAAHQGWITTRGTAHPINIGGREFQLFLDWDVVLFYIAEVVLIGYALYGNYVLLAIRR